MLFDIDTNDLFSTIGQLYVEKQQLNQIVIAQRQRITELEEQLPAVNEDDATQIAVPRKTKTITGFAHTDTKD